jgi:peptide/nickel transport system substrate-binding protein
MVNRVRVLRERQDAMARESGSGSSRRDFLRGGIALGGLALAGAACSSGSGSGATATSGNLRADNVGGAIIGKPKKGGVLRLGISGGGVADSVDAAIVNSPTDQARQNSLYDALSIRDHQFQLRHWLAEEYIPNKTNDEWIVRLRPDVTFHNGKPLTADDVIYTFQRILDPAVGASASALLSFIDPKGMTKVDTHTIRFQLPKPFGSFEDRVANGDCGIVPVGYDPHHPVGTGPFKFVSFTPATQSVFTRWDDYWGSGAGNNAAKIPGLPAGGPWVDELWISDITDDTARINALSSGVVDAIDAVPYSAAGTISSQPHLQILISKTGCFRPFTMRVDQAPFTDVRVRQAFRLMVNRQEMVNVALAGYGSVANDLCSPQDPLFNHSLPPREQDIDQAKFLLKKAGQENLTIQLVTSDIAGGVIEMSTVFQQQAKAAGVTVNISTLPTTTFYNGQYLYRLLSVDWWGCDSLLTQAAYDYGPGADFNDTQWHNARYNALYDSIIGLTDVQKQLGPAHAMQEMLYNEGGDIIWAYPDGCDAYSKKVTGLVPDFNGQGLSQFFFKDVWFV